jgi:hypothetical protein
MTGNHYQSHQSHQSHQKEQEQEQEQEQEPNWHLPGRPKHHNMLQNLSISTPTQMYVFLLVSAW